MNEKYEDVLAEVEEQAGAYKALLKGTVRSPKPDPVRGRRRS